MLQFSPNSTIALVGSSDGLPRGSDAVPRLCAFLESLGLRTVVFPSLYQTAAGTPQPAERRAADIQAAFASPEVDAVFDLTGGDGANVVLPRLDLRKIAHTPKPFFGYSDVSALLNPLQDFGHVPVFYCQPRFLASCPAAAERFTRWIQRQDDDLFRFRCTFLQGSQLSGKVCGGNIRCTLKLAGTPWQPDSTGRVLFLESYSGSLARMETMLHQYRQMGMFSRCSGVLLGNFSELAKKQQLPELYRIVQDIIADPALPLAVTTELGHQPDARCLAYAEICLEKTQL